MTLHHLVKIALDLVRRLLLFTGARFGYVLLSTFMPQWLRYTTFDMIVFVLWWLVSLYLLLGPPYPFITTTPAE